MSQRCIHSRAVRPVGLRHFAALAGWLLLGGVAAAQDSVPPTPLSATLTDSSRRAVDVSLASEQSLSATIAATGGVRRVTLDQAQQLATAANDPLVRLGRLQVEAAREHRKGVEALYLPNVATQFENMHFNKTLGDPLTVQRPLAGTTLSIPVTIINQDQTFWNFSAVQPITPLFAIRQMVTIARADEAIARAKAGMAPAERASLVEETYFNLLVAQQELLGASADVSAVRANWIVVGSQPQSRVSAAPRETIGAARSWVIAASQVRELSASLNALLGLPLDTRLELVTPDPLVEHVSFADVTAAAAAPGVELVEAEQTAVKAHAASKLAKMAYFPTIALFGGWAHQTALNAILPDDFAYVGVMATYTLFDGLKRERSIKESHAQSQAAQLGVELTKAKAAAAVRTSYFDLERSRGLVQLARMTTPAPRMADARYLVGASVADPERTRLDIEWLRAELEYRQAYARLKALMGGREE